MEITLLQKYRVDDALRSKLAKCVESVDDVTYDTILSIPLETLQRLGLKQIIEEMHSYGLHFKSETEYQEDWEKMCRADMIKNGLDTIKNEVSYETPNSSFFLAGKKFGDDYFYSILNSVIEELDLPSRQFTILKHSNINTIKDLVMMTEEEIVKIHGISPEFAKVLHKRIQMIGVEFRPGYMSNLEWLKYLKSKFFVKGEEKVATETHSSKKKEPVKRPLTQEEQFRRFYNQTIEEFDFDVRVFNLLKRNEINTIGELIMMTEEELTEIRGTGSKFMSEIVTKLEANGLSLRTKGVSKRQWLAQLKKDFYENLQKANGSIVE